jgi:hypothetical protein
LAMWMDKGEAASGKRIISMEAVTRALGPATAFNALPTGFDKHAMFYGQNWMIYRQEDGLAPDMPIFGHGGSDGTYALAVPDHDLIVLYFTQSRGGTTVLGMDSLIRPLIGQPPAAKLENHEWTAEQTEPLLGFYHIAVLDEVGAVVRHGSQIALEIPSQQEYVLRWPDAKGDWAFELAPSITMTFDEPVSRRSPGFVIHQAGMEHRGERCTPAAGELPSVDDLIALRRAHGDDRLKTPRNYRLTGDMHIESKKMDGTISLLIEGASRFSQESNFEKAFERTVVRDGRVWTNSTGLSPSEQEGVFRGQKLRAFQPYRLGDWHDLFKDVAVVRRTKIGEEPVIEVRGSPADGGAVRMFVSETTGLTLSERSLVVVKGIGAVPTTANFEDYREVDGVKVPFGIVIESKLSGRIVIQFNKAETNIDLPSDAFEMKVEN